MENQAATKAQIVKALKAMLRDLTHGDEVKGANKRQCLCFVGEGVQKESQTRSAIMN